MRFRQLAFFFLIFSGLVFSGRSMGAATFSGTIALPSGVNAGASGVELRVGTAGIEFYTGPNGFPRFASDFVRIPPFANSVNFSFDLPPSPNNDLNRVDFSCVSGCELLDVTTSGNWSESEGVVASFIGGTEYDSRVDQTINIRLETADTFKGRLNLPQGFVASGDEQIIVRVRDTTRFSFVSSIDSIFPAAGESSFPFVVGMPQGGGGNWEVEVSCLRCDSEIEARDHYLTTFSGDPLTINQEEGVLFPKNSDSADLSLTLISLREPEPPIDPNRLNTVDISPIIYLILEE